MFDWKLFSTTFLTIFLAELGDKTQFAALGLSSGPSRVWEVWLGVVLALALAGTLGVVAGKFLAGMISLQILRWISGVAFIAMGVWVLWEAARSASPSS